MRSSELFGERSLFNLEVRMNEWLTVQQLADLAGVHRVTMYTWLKAHDVRHRRIGRNIMVHLNDVGDLRVRLARVRSLMKEVEKAS